MANEGEAMSKETAGRQYQDSVFRAYFNDADRLRDLAGALHGRTYTMDDAVEIVTLEGDISLAGKKRYLVPAGGASFGFH